jgi:glyoxylate reductase
VLARLIYDLAVARVFVTSPVVGNALERLIAAGHEVDLWKGSAPPPGAGLLEHARRADALLCTLVDRIDADFLAACSHLKVVSSCAVGVDNVDLGAARAHGIPVGNTPDVLTDATADLAFALLLAAARRLPQTAEAVRRGEWGPWNPTAFLGHDIAGATLGIVGAGRIGQAVAHRAAAFGMDVLATTSRGGMPLSRLLAEADFVSLHVPLTHATRHLIDAAALARMKPTAILVNTARGAIVDEAALAAALRDRSIAGAALDCFATEPLPADSPLRNVPGITVYSHLAGQTAEARRAAGLDGARELVAALRGRPRSSLNAHLLPPVRAEDPA